TLMSIIPGGGQFYNQQAPKGILFLILFILFLYQLYTTGLNSINGLITLGTTPGEDHSLFLCTEGVLQVLFVFLFLAFYAVQLYVANRVSKIKELHQDKLNHSIKDILINVYENGFPYLLTVPAYILMLFAIIFPVLVTFLLIFTNYDFNHIPPATLIEWTGLKTFTSMFSISTYRETFMS